MVAAIFGPWMQVWSPGTADTDFYSTMTGKRDSEALMDDPATAVEHAQLRIGVHTTLPVSKRFKSIVQGYTGSLETSELALGTYCVSIYHELR